MCPMQNNEIYVSVKSVCENLGLDSKSQRNRIKEDAILSEVEVELTSTGKDEKMYNMSCIPLKYLNGWLFQIDDKKVNPEARKNLLAYKKECYDVLFHHFFGTAKQLEQNARKAYEVMNQNRKILGEIKDVNREIKLTELGKKLKDLQLTRKSNKQHLELIQIDNYVQLGLWKDEEVEENKGGNE